MDTTQFAEGQFIKPELVKLSPSKKVYISADARVVQGKFGDKLELDVELDGKKKVWSPTIDHVKAMQESFGKDSRGWVGQTVTLKVLNVLGKETILALPEKTKEEVV